MLKRPNPQKIIQNTGQTAVEYMLLFGVVVAIVLVSFKTQLPRVSNAANFFFYNTTQQLHDGSSSCGDGIITQAEIETCSCPCDFSCSGQPCN